MTPFENKFNSLPENLQKEVMDFVEFLEQKNKKSKRIEEKVEFNWGGALKDIKDKYSSVELQKKVLDWF